MLRVTRGLLDSLVRGTDFDFAQGGDRGIGEQNDKLTKITERNPLPAIGKGVWVIRCRDR